MSAHPTAVWIDHHEARIFRAQGGKFDEATMRAPQRVDRYPEDRTAEHSRPDDAHSFHNDVARALEGDEPILIVGPSTAKLHFLRYIDKHEHALESKITGIETVEHPTDGQIAAYARRYFGIPDTPADRPIGLACD
jgi:stalled ribosome rescue protein Dom34